MLPRTAHCIPMKSLLSNTSWSTTITQSLPHPTATNVTVEVFLLYKFERSSTKQTSYDKIRT
eukprot:TRINITY_DN10807_c0_g1_i1.p2 TRINITY_DN10807_c0_g1~~TRINITY_DN10807_c0_g1_i1.p2  ORF type:complete len:62 (-),score=4.19 TRINITY_DN10807_c0_g1_i1:274-459(-)